MDNLLDIKNLTVEYRSLKNEISSVVTAVKNVSLNIKQGEIYALAGESGCGKSTLSKAITKLVKPVSGEILFDGKNIFEQTKEEKKAYPTNVQMVFQNPYSSLNPKMTIGAALQEPLDINTKFSKSRKKAAIHQVLEEVGLTDDILNRYPHEFSGGQRQRIAIARALILNPKLLIADEPVSALDASIQAQIINLLKELKQERNLTILFISHDLSVIKYLADRVGIMYFGELIEENVTSAIFNSPQKDYTKMLLNSAPILKNWRSYSLIWKMHFTQCAFGWRTKLSSKSYILAILVIKGSPQRGHLKLVSRFKIFVFNSSIVSWLTISNL